MPKLYPSTILTQTDTLESQSAFPIFCNSSILYLKSQPAFSGRLFFSTLEAEWTHTNFETRFPTHYIPHKAKSPLTQAQTKSPTTVGRIKAITVQNVLPVSFLIVDVYKRQVLHHKIKSIEKLPITVLFLLPKTVLKENAFLFFLLYHLKIFVSTDFFALHPCMNIV